MSFCFLLGSCNSKVDITESSQLSYELEKVVDHDGIIWSIEFLDNENIIFTDKEGQIYTFNGSEKNEIEGAPEIYLSTDRVVLWISSCTPTFKIIIPFILPMQRN